MKIENNYLTVTGASENNLKNIDIQIPHNSITVITGVSGSGKSSLAYNVIYKESQRRFLESFSSYSRQYIGKLEKPKVNHISGLQAALAINQKSVVSNPRSTVGTISGIYDYLRLLYARIGVAHCTNCNSVLKPKATKCNNCGNEQQVLLAKSFSFNSKYGTCPTCNGLGVTEQIDKSKLIANHNLSLREGALVPTTPYGYIVYSQVRVDELNKVCNAHGFSVEIPWKDLTKEQQDVIWYGSDRVTILFGKHSLESRLKWKGITALPREEAHYKGMIPIMEDILRRDRNDNILRFASSFVCNECEGTRLNKEARHVYIKGKNIAVLCELQLSELRRHLENIVSSFANNEVFSTIHTQVTKRLEYLGLLGLDYLTLSRESTTLSGGESQRIRLASQVGSKLQGILYILDEPSIGLHPKDNKRLLKVLRSLRDNGNTLLVVEHDEETIKSADYLIDIGPKAGNSGGEVIYQGDAVTLLKNSSNYPLSKTAETISLENEVGFKSHTRCDKGTIRIIGASENNLKNINVSFKLNAFNVVTGVSGAGKSTLVHRVLATYLTGKTNEINCNTISSTKQIKRIIEIDQSPIGRTPRSNPATYTDLFDNIRNLFAKQLLSKERGYSKGRFSFNNKGGRCEKCQGAGYIQLGMHFLGNIEILCDECNGQRFNNETLEVRYNDKSIDQILKLSVNEAREFFNGETKITRILDQLINLDVGYLKLGQSSTTLSGGEAQRVKLASELYKTSKGHALYILDEPTVGLHKADIKFLIDALNGIVDNDNTVIVIEHDPDIIKQADFVVDLGPDGGEKGGYVIAQTTPIELINCNNSYTGKALKDYLFKKDILPNRMHTAIVNENIKFTGVSTNNLKNIDVEIPLNNITVITGVSGSGKSSLAFDTIYSESRNRFTENFSTYARRMMSKVKKPELEQCSGITPAIALAQNRFGKNPRSTVGTISEIFDLYRLLFSRTGIAGNGTKTNLPASMFSFNKPEAACTQCKGLGIITTANPDSFITHPEKSLIAGAMDGTTPGKYFGNIYGQHTNTLIKVGEVLGIDFSIPFKTLSEEAIKIAMNGTGQEIYDIEWNFKRGNRTGTHRMSTDWKGFTNYFNEEYELLRNRKRGESYNQIMREITCQACNGERFKKEILNVTFNNENISELSSRTISNSLNYFSNIKSELCKEYFTISEHIIGRIITKLTSLENIGLGYLSVNRNASTLSGGEAQRLRISNQLTSDLCGLTYVLDEPTVGLHPRDTENLMKAVNRLKDNGNTIIIVEHDPDIISQADNIIDIGPGAGEHGGHIIGQGTLEQIMLNRESPTGQYFNGSKKSQPKLNRVLVPSIKIVGAAAHNLKNIDLEIPAGGIVSLTGVSGSGKSSLAIDVIAKSYISGRAMNCDDISFSNIDSITVIDQQKIGRSPLSIPSTYTGMFDLIRELFSKQDISIINRYNKSYFSFNSKEGRCATCKGMGSVKVSMDFLSDVWVVCDTCMGRRYNKSVLEVTFNGHNIYEILNLSITEALKVFHDHPKIVKILNVLDDVGLGYVKLGQATSTLSGGETQRLKLANELIKTTKGNSLYLFDEPSAGLHMQDVEKLLKVFNNLVDNDNTVIVIEHNFDIIRASDWIIDLGPEGGDNGGNILYSGKLSGIKNCDLSYTGKAL